MRSVYKICSLFLCVSAPLGAQHGQLKVTYDFFLSLAATEQYVPELLVGSESSLFLWGVPVASNREVSEDDLYIDLGANDTIGNFTYTDKVKDSMFTRSPFLRETYFCLRESIPQLPWKISSETKKVGPYNCERASVTFRGREYQVWFTREVPVNSGPWKLQGLPGLILEAADTTGEIRFRVKSITALDTVFIPDFNGTTPVSTDEFANHQRSISKELTRLMMSKLPRDATVSITGQKSMEYFD